LTIFDARPDALESLCFPMSMRLQSRAWLFEAAQMPKMSLRKPYLSYRFFRFMVEMPAWLLQIVEYFLHMAEKNRPWNISMESTEE